MTRRGPDLDASPANYDPQSGTLPDGVNPYPGANDYEARLCQTDPMQCKLSVIVKQVSVEQEAYWGR